MTNLPRQENITQVKEYLKNRYFFKYNSVSNRIEFKPGIDTKRKPSILTDYHANSIRYELLDAGLWVSDAEFRSLLNSNYTEAYNPFINYFHRLPKWKKSEPDHIAYRASAAKTTDPALWQRCFKKWIVGVVACAMDDSVVNHTAIVFTGKQGIGKTTFLHNLMPERLREYYFEGTINPGNKDTLAHLSECLLVNLDELENLSRNDVGSLKQIITLNEIRMRRPYGTINENFPRRASFCGSVNNKEFLKDKTGNRRFLCFEALQFKNENQPSPDRMYAQALHLWRTGFQYWFDQKEIQEINDHNKEFELVAPEEDALLEYYEPGKEEDKGTQRLTTTEVHRFIEQFCKLPPTDASISQLGKALHAHDFVRMKSGGRQLWLVKLKVDLRGNKIV